MNLTLEQLYTYSHSPSVNKRVRDQTTSAVVLPWDVWVFHISAFTHKLQLHGRISETGWLEIWPQICHLPAMLPWPWASQSLRDNISTSLWELWWGWNEMVCTTRLAQCPTWVRSQTVRDDDGDDDVEDGNGFINLLLKIVFPRTSQLLNFLWSCCCCYCCCSHKDLKYRPELFKDIPVSIFLI